MAISWSQAMLPSLNICVLLPNDFTDVAGLDTVLTTNATTLSLSTEQDSTGVRLLMAWLLRRRHRC